MELLERVRTAWQRMQRMVSPTNMTDYTPDHLAKIREAEKSLSTREEAQSNFAMVMQPYGNVEDLISPAPLSIALLGQLILLSLETDLSLLSKDDPSPQYLTHPGSLRASLLQVSHAGWDAFNLAHKNMDAIRLKTGNVPHYVNDSVKIIIAGTREEMEVTLPKSLKNIKRIATDCTKKAQDVELKFVDVMQVIQELLKYCTAKRGDHEREIKENKAALKAAALAKEQVEKEQEFAEENLKEMKKLLKQSREDYKTALDKMPSAMSILGMSVIEKAVYATGYALWMSSNPVKYGAISAIAGLAGHLPRTGDIDQSTRDGSAEEEELSRAELRRLSMSLEDLKNIIEALQEYLDPEKEPKKCKKGTDEIVNLKATANQLLDGMKKKKESDFSKSVSTGLKQAMVLIEEVLQLENSMSSSPGAKQRMKKEAANMQRSAEKLTAQLRVQGRTMPTIATPMKSSATNTNSFSIQAAVSLSRMKCEQTSLVMRQYMEQYTAANKRNQETNKEMTALVAQIAQYELKELDFDKIRETLIQGIKVMGTLKEQWSKLVQYFQMMSNIVECTLQESLYGFLEFAECGQELRMKNSSQYSPSKAMRDVIYLQASKANQIAFLVQGLSGTYVEVSDKYILRPLAGLDSLMALDADEDKTKIKEFQKTLQRGAEDAAEAINQLVQQRHDEIMEKGYERIAKYEKTMREALPPPSAEEEKELQEMREAAAKPLSEPSVDIGGW